MGESAPSACACAHSVCRYKTRLAAIRADKQELIFLRMAVDDLDGEVPALCDVLAYQYHSAGSMLNSVLEVLCAECAE